ncbi:MAG: HpaII family restriction endonuclease [Rickettsiales bacterium]
MNKGEWSELYVFLRLLGTGKLHAADAHLNPREDFFYPVYAVRRTVGQERIDAEYRRCNEGDTVVIKAVTTARIVSEVNAAEYVAAADLLFEKVRASKGEASFEIPEIAHFVEKIGNPLLKSGSQNKQDVKVAVHDPVTQRRQELGFSIKSRLGGKSTLFNAAKHSTCFLYEAESAEKLSDEVFQGKKTKSLLAELAAHGCTLHYVKVEDDQFRRNIAFCDSQLDLILADLMAGYYSGLGTKITELTGLTVNKNPCGYDLSCGQPFYESKIKRFLLSVALGMTARKIWCGIYDANGGYVIVNESGNIVCYHIYNWNAFEDYLFSRTCFDTPSTGRHDFGTLFTGDDGTQYLRLCMQIRFD